MEFLGAITGLLALAISGLQELRHHRERSLKVRVSGMTRRAGVEIPNLYLHRYSSSDILPNVIVVADPELWIEVTNPGKQTVTLKHYAMAEHRIRNPDGLLPIFQYGATMLLSSGRDSFPLELAPGKNYETSVAYQQIIERMDARFLGAWTRIVFDDALGNRYGSQPFTAVRIPAERQ